MATLTVQATGVGATDDWILAAGASKAAAVNSPDDDDTSYISRAASQATQEFTGNTSSIPAGSTITQVEVFYRLRRDGANNVNFDVGYAFTPQGGGSQSAFGSSAAASSYASGSFQDTGLNVLWGSDFVFFVRNTQNRAIACTTLYAVITYTPPAAAGKPTHAMHYFRLRS